MKAHANTISVIIVNKDGRAIENTLDALAKMRGGTVSFEVIVVDKSLPEQMADIKAKHDWVIWDEFPRTKERTTPAQRNRGLELATGDIIAFIDANCIPAANWLEAIMDSAQAGEDIITGPVLDLSKTNLVHYHAEHTKGRYVDVCYTGNVGLRRKVVDRIGNFDTTFAYGQDVDFFWRATDAGFKIYFNPKVVIGHDWGKTNEQVRRAYHYGKARAHLYKKHWRTRLPELAHEPHVWVYPLFIVGLPLTYWLPVYPLLVVVPVLKNRTGNPLGLIMHHLTYGVGVIAGLIKPWPKPTA
jgi:glycosyltransferase involved in cell wall biosynthesis